MRVKMEKRKTRGIRVILITGLLSASSNYASQGKENNFQLYPKGDFSVDLIQRPYPPTLSTQLMPLQEAQANSDFNMYLRSYINISKPELVYRITNNYTTAKTKTTDLNVSFVGLPLLPNGIVLVPKYAGDCYINYGLVEHQACALRFNVDTDNYYSSPYIPGPIAQSHATWMWGSHRDIPGGAYKDARPLAQANFGIVIAPIISPVRVIVSPTSQDGLYYDPTTMRILGKPTHTGIYTFKVSAANAFTKSEEQTLEIKVNDNPKDKPIFKSIYTIASAMRTKEYHLNLMDLLEPTPGFMVTNQIKFRIDVDQPHPEWLSIDESSTLLKSKSCTSKPGQLVEVTLIATSNTGGDSLPLTIQIPIAIDPTQKPIIENNIELHGEAGKLFYEDLRSQIVDPSGGDSLQLTVEKIEPAAPWLQILPSNPTELRGPVPKDAVGQKYQITLHANNAAGGNSESKTISLAIEIDKEKTPFFYGANPQLPLFYKGQSYSYDFVENEDIYPQYSDIPYIVELAADHNNPSWVRIENNKIVVDEVPKNTRQVERLFITIKNIPGGQSEVILLDLFIMK